jgi:hypothetical protein
VVEITAVHKADWVSKAFAKAIGAIGGVVVKAIPAGDAALAFLGSSVGSVFEQLTPKDKTYIIGRGTLALQERMADGLQTINLTVPRDVKLWKAEPPRSNMGTAPPAGRKFGCPRASTTEP